MTAVSISALGAGLSRCVRHVRRGGEVQVLDREAPVPPGRDGRRPMRSLLRAVRTGLVAGPALAACDPQAPRLTRDDLAMEVRQLAADRGLEALPNPAPVRRSLVVLGQALAFDKILSGNRNIACMSCHLPGMATGDGMSLSVGEGGAGLGPGRTHPDGVFIPRNSPAVFNLPGASRLFWDGRVEEMPDGSFRTPAGEQLTPAMAEVFEFGAVSAQGLFPVTSREEMRGHPGQNDLGDLADDDFEGMWDLLMERLGEIPEYVDLFERAYPGTRFDEMSFAHASNAIAGFYAAAFVFTDTPWDRFLRGDNDALGDSALAGAHHFLTVGCADCHKRSSFGGGFHNAALAQFGPGRTEGREDFGREEVTGAAGDRRRFMARPLRNVELTAPYGHLGQFATLETFVAHYDNAALQLRRYEIADHVPDPRLWPTLLDNFDEIIAGRDTLLSALRFDGETLAGLVAFLRALTDEAARDLAHTIPHRVPSGLPIDRMHE